MYKSKLEAVSIAMEKIENKYPISYQYNKKWQKLRDYRNKLSYEYTQNELEYQKNKYSQTNNEESKKLITVFERLIKKYEMRIDTHPDPFLVLNSKNPVVLKNSINVLNHHQQIFKLLGVKGKMVLHIGSGADDKKAAMQRFVENFQKLNETIKSMIIIENDDKVFNVLDTLNLAKKLKVPMVLDYHHYKCHNNQEDIKDYLLDILNTWGTERPKMHFSSPKNLKEKRSHAEYIDVNEFIKFLEILKPFNRDIDIMLECKGKDMALFKLVRELRYKTNYTFIDNTTFII